MRKCPGCKEELIEQAIAFCTSCGYQLVASDDLPTLETNFQARQATTLVFADSEISKPNPKKETNRSRIFTSAEVADFEDIFGNLDVLMRVSATNVEDERSPDRDTINRKGAWNVQASLLELLLKCYYQDSILFGSFDLSGDREIISEAEDGRSVAFILNFGDYDVSIDPRPLLFKFDLISTQTTDRWYYRFTKRMHRFVRWIEYNEITPSKSTCVFIEFPVGTFKKH